MKINQIIGSQGTFEFSMNITIFELNDISSESSIEKDSQRKAISFPVFCQQKKKNQQSAFITICVYISVYIYSKSFEMIIRENLITLNNNNFNDMFIIWHLYNINYIINCNYFHLF